MRRLPPGYSIHTGTDGRLQAWYNNEPLTPGMWWEGHQLWGAQEDCFKDKARRDAVHLVAVQQKYEALSEQAQRNNASNTYRLFTLLQYLDESPYVVQEHVRYLLSCIHTVRRYHTHTSKQTRSDGKHMEHDYKRALKFFVPVLQELGVEVPHDHTWPY